MVTIVCFVVVFVETMRLFIAHSKIGCSSLSLVEEQTTPMTSKQDFKVSRLSKKQPQQHRKKQNKQTLDANTATEKDESEENNPPEEDSKPTEEVAEESEEESESPDAEEESEPESEGADSNPQTGNNKATIDNPTINGLPITSETHIHEFSSNLDQTAEFSENFCVPWDVNSDLWWTHHPEWEMGAENDTHYCFQEIQSEKKRQRYKALYEVQFSGNCTNVHTKRMWNSGWSADFTNVVDGLSHAELRKKPVQIVEAKPWHFAHPARKPTKENRHVPPACPRKNMFCYFLPLSNCKPAETGSKSQFLERKMTGTWKYQTYYEYATRRQTWLRKQIYDFAKKQNVEGPCTAIHVRR